MLLSALAEIVGPRHVRNDRDALEQFGVDRSSGWRPAPTCVVLPGSTAEVQRIVQLAREQRIALVPSGGRTGLSGGAVARNGELVVALERMDRLIDFDPVARSLTVQAGMITARVQEHASAQGFHYGVDFASAGSSHIGGNVATNAGGTRVIRYGMTRDQVLGLQVVDGNGEVLELNRGLIKNNSGPDFRHLFIGSEGILGIVTEVTLRLQRQPPMVRVMLLGVPDCASIMQVLQVFSRDIELAAFEFFADNALRKVLRHTDASAPLEGTHAFYCLLEIEADDTDRALALFEHCLAQGWVRDGVLSQSLGQARALWRLREDISETLSRWHPYKTDISVAISRMPAFIEQVEALVRREYAAMEVVWYGHIGDGNLHLNILKPDGMAAAQFTARCAGATRSIATLLGEFGGSISAEHGVGLLKKDYLCCTRSAGELQLLRRVKDVFDPLGIMNPGKVID